MALSDHIRRGYLGAALDRWHGQRSGRRLCIPMPWCRPRFRLRRCAASPLASRAALRISLGGTYALVRSGEIPAIKLGGRWVIPKRRFAAWLDSCLQEPMPPTAGPIG